MHAELAALVFLLRCASTQSAAKISPLGTNATPTATCFDAWAVKYPAEVNERSKRSCKWKLEWNQCGQYGDYCKLTCGKCTGGTRAVLTAKPHPQPAQAREGG